MRRWLQTFLAGFRRPKRAVLRLSVTEDTLCLFADDQSAWTLRWEEVTRIDTYKRDLFTVDMICLDFTMAGRQMYCQTHDEMEGFDVLCQQLGGTFPSIAPDWWMQVAFPAFATQHRVLYEVPVG